MKQIFAAFRYHPRRGNADEKNGVEIAINTKNTNKLADPKRIFCELMEHT